jgi:hypothetical protein
LDPANPWSLLFITPRALTGARSCPSAPFSANLPHIVPPTLKRLSWGKFLVKIKGGVEKVLINCRDFASNVAVFD